MVLCILNVELPAFQNGHSFLGLDGQDEFLNLGGQQPHFNLLQNAPHMILDRGLCGDQQIESILLGHLEVLGCIQSSLEE